LERYGKKGQEKNKDEGIMLLNPRTRSYEFRQKGNGMRKEKWPGEATSRTD
jgi:hypothetical protein